MAAQIAEAIKRMCQGVHLMPHNLAGLVPEIVRAAGLRD
jgi:5,10-methylenetetrahydrofolate reductase